MALVRNSREINLVWFLLVSIGPLAMAQTTVQPPPKYAAAVEQLKKLAEHEISAKPLPGLSIALVEDQKVVWAQGFGFADPEKKTAATAETVYRVGSVSKLFTDMAIMQRVERGQLDLDAPVTNYLPDFHPKNPFAAPITLRELMAHRSGLVREPPVGNYFDSSEPALAAVVKSLNVTELVYAPGTHTKYSNAGDTIAGLVLESQAHQSYAQSLQETVLRPTGLTSSSFRPGREMIQRLAKGFMWTYDGRTFPAPTFALGTGPAGNLYSTVLDQARFLSMIFADGRGLHGQVLKPETLQEMFRPQYPNSGYGLGFALLNLDGLKMVGHRGGIYGFSSEVLAMPEEKLGVVVITNIDEASEVAWHVAITSLRFLLAARASKPLPRLTLPVDVPEAMRHNLVGRYEHGGSAMEVFDRNDKLYLEPLDDGPRSELRITDSTLLTDDRNGWGYRLTPVEGGFAPFGDTKNVYTKVADEPPSEVPESWRPLLGEYGWDYNVLHIIDRNNHLTALLEMDYAPLTPVSNSKDEWAFSADSAYDRETLIFVRGKNGCALEAKVGGVVFPRRSPCTQSWPNGMYP